MNSTSLIVDLTAEVNKLNTLSRQNEDLRDQSAKINREECSVRNQRLAALKVLAEKLKQILKRDDFDELYKHLPPRQKGEPL